MIVESVTRLNLGSVIRVLVCCIQFLNGNIVDDTLKMRTSLVIIILTLISIGDFFVNGVPIVHIKNGTLEGIVMKSRKGREFFAFRGIPYALPPLGELRFEPPRPAASWTGVRSAKNDADICTQRNIYIHQEEVVGIEDCLYLNVYTPKLPSFKNGSYHSGYPIMIWYHGGGWVTGAGLTEFYSPKFLLDHDVILVTINYRLGPLGFLSTEDLVCPGNQGLKDQAMSIRWISENIAAFGGDPNSVTLFGESAGGASTHYHMLSSLTKGLFHRGISQSGSALCPWGVTRSGSARKQAHRLGELVGCPMKNSEKLLACLREKNDVDIIATDRAFQVFDYCPMIPFRPVVEPSHSGAFLTEDPAITLKTGRVIDIPWMTGITANEGALKVASIYGLKDGEYMRQLDQDFMNIAPMSLLYENSCPKHLLENVTQRIREFYFGDRPIDESTRFNTIDMYTDAWFYVSTDTSVRNHLDGLAAPVFYYYFTYKGGSSFTKHFGDPERDYGVSHADDLQYLFPVGEQLFKDKILSDEDHRMIDIMTNMWFNFAKFGNPTPEVTPEVPAKWMPVRTHALEYLHIGNSRELFMASNIFSERIKFWTSLPLRKDLFSPDEVHQIRDEL